MHPCIYYTVRVCASLRTVFKTGASRLFVVSVGEHSPPPSSSSPFRPAVQGPSAFSLPRLMDCLTYARLKADFHEKQKQKKRERDVGTMSLKNFVFLAPLLVPPPLCLFFCCCYFVCLYGAGVFIILLVCLHHSSTKRLLYLPTHTNTCLPHRTSLR
jgi:hypothetical protein